MNGRTLSNESGVGMPHHFCIQSDLTHPHTSVPDKITDKVRELDNCGSSSIVYSRVVVDLFQLKPTAEGEGTGYLRCR